MEKVLIVDDDAVMRETVSKIVTSLGYFPIQCCNGLQALEMLRGASPYLIVSDVMMPYMDGKELLKAIKQDIRYGQIPVVMLTGSTDEEIRWSSMELGADIYLTKPFDFREFEYKLKNLLNLKQRLIQEVRASRVPKSPSERFEQKLKSMLHREIQRISLDRIAELMELSASGLQKKIRRYLHKTFQQHARSVKLEYARKLMESGKFNVGQVSTQSGFQSISTFSKVFKEEFGISPGKFLSDHVKVSSKR